MERARATAAVALFAILLAATVALAVAAPALRQAALEPLAAVGWPPSTLVVTEVQTGGASASDEFAEIGNMGAAAVDLAGLEVAYVTASGGTVTRKAAWTAPLLLEPGGHLVIANGSGVFAPIADATYSGGFAATGGAIVLRVIGGAPIDALGWGDATNAFVEGSVVTAPAAGSSVERRPGGTAGNTTDTNDNLADFFAQAIPNPQNLAAPPVPAPGPTASPPAATPSPTVAPTVPPTPTPTPTPVPAPTPTGTVTPVPTPSATPDASGSTSPDPTLEPTPTAAATPTAVPTPTPEPTPAASATTAPTPTPSSTPVASPSSTPSADPSSSPEPTPAPTVVPSPSPAAIAIADARALPDGSAAIVVGTLTTDLGALEAGRSGFVQDATAGIAIYLDAVPTNTLPAGTIVRLDGELDTRYGARTLRVGTTAVVDLGTGALPDAGDVATGLVGEELEGLRVTVTGTTIGSATSFADGLGILVDDGSGSVRVIVGPDALAGAVVPSGTFVRAVGPVGQRDSSGTGTSGYRIHATEPGELEILPPPATPTPAPTPTPGPTTTGSPTPTPTPSPTPSPSPSAAPAPAMTIAEARGRTVGSVVTVAGVVTAEAGRLGTPSLLALGDATGGIVVRLPEGAVAPGRGTRLAISGPIAAPYGQLEIRPSTSGFRAIGSGPLPDPIEVLAGELGEGSEGSLLSIVGTVTATPRKSTSDDLAIDLVDAAGTAFRVMTDASSRLGPTDLSKGGTYRLVGIAGQRASKKDVLDGYRVWLRDAADVIAASGGSTGPTSTPAGPASTQVMTIATARRLDDDTPTLVEGVVIAGPGLLDMDGRRIVIQDATAGIEVVLGADQGAPAGGARIRVAGTVGHAWDAPRIRATEIIVLGTGPDVAARVLGGAPGESVEWQLVRIAGTITDVTRLGDRWRAEVRVGGSSILVTGLAGAGIASTSLVEGRAVTVVGIVRRPYPTATDRRWTVIPRGPWDLAVGPASSGSGTARSSGGGGGSSGSGSGGPGGSGSGAGTSAAPYPGVPDVDLAALGDHLGELVRIGGLVVAGGATGFSLDDGTAIGHVELRGEAAAFLDLIEAGDALGIVGRVVPGVGGEPVVRATDPAGLVRLGSLGESVPLAAAVDPSGAAGPSFGPVSAAGLADPLGGLDGGRLGLVGLALASLGSLVVTIARRRRADLGLRRIVATRIAGLGAPSGSAGSPSDRA